jgi:hypothetical protein
MSSLERLFALEVEFQRRLRCEAPRAVDTASLHTSYALQTGYESLLGSAGRATPLDLERMANRFALAGDPRDALAARDSLIRLLAVQTYDP